MGYKSPIYGRRTGQILVKPLGFVDVAKYIGDVKRAVELGIDGVLVAHKVAKARNPQQALLSLLQDF